MLALQLADRTLTFNTVNTLTLPQQSPVLFLYATRYLTAASPCHETTSLMPPSLQPSNETVRTGSLHHITRTKVCPRYDNSTQREILQRYAPVTVLYAAVHGFLKAHRKYLQPLRRPSHSRLHLTILRLNLTVLQLHLTIGSSTGRINAEPKLSYAGFYPRQHLTQLNGLQIDALFKGNYITVLTLTADAFTYANSTTQSSRRPLGLCYCNLYSAAATCQ